MRLNQELHVLLQMEVQLRCLSRGKESCGEKRASRGFLGRRQEHGEGLGARLLSYGHRPGSQTRLKVGCVCVNVNVSVCGKGGWGGGAELLVSGRSIRAILCGKSR